ncbi:MAG: hypothetical protein AMS26_06310 [Bacteroides sp. SM23_62]|nr:MAG: hypothetical protein AMS26_06310 [Bacteroides sp. SM23_62]
MDYPSWSEFFLEPGHLRVILMLGLILGVQMVQIAVKLIGYSSIKPISAPGRPTLVRPVLNGF